jgi:hypothetical protein
MLSCCVHVQGLGKGWPSIRLELPLVIDATFCAGAGMIAFGAVLGKTTPTQLTWIMVGMVSQTTNRVKPKSNHPSQTT